MLWSMKEWWTISKMGHPGSNTILKYLTLNSSPNSSSFQEKSWQHYMSGKLMPTHFSPDLQLSKRARLHLVSLNKPWNNWMLKACYKTKKRPFRPIMITWYRDRSTVSAIMSPCSCLINAPFWSLRIARLRLGKSWLRTSWWQSPIIWQIRGCPSLTSLRLSTPRVTVISIEAIFRGNSLIITLSSIWTPAQGKVCQ